MHVKCTGAQQEVQNQDLDRICYSHIVTPTVVSRIEATSLPSPDSPHTLRVNIYEPGGKGIMEGLHHGWRWGRSLTSSVLTLMKRLILP